MEEYIRKQDAFDILTDYYHHTTDTQHFALKEALDRCPVARYPLSTYDRVGFLDFLYNMLPPNEIEHYLDMYRSHKEHKDSTPSNGAEAIT